MSCLTSRQMHGKVRRIRSDRKQERGKSRSKKKSKRNRSGVATHLARRAKRLTGKHSWFQDKTKEKEETPTFRRKNTQRQPPPQEDRKVYEAVIFVPITPGGDLRRRLTKLEDSLNQPTRVKFVEDMGISASEE